ncbi:MAG: hypothetical protein ACJ788_10655 [Ktedonobacteraceae bacterium]
MSMQEAINTQEFLTSFKGFMDQAVMQAPTQEPAFARYLRTHFKAEPKDLPIVAEQFEKSEHPNLHVAITTLLAREGWSSELLGVVAVHEYMGVKIATLLSKQHGAEATPGPVEYINITLNDDRVLACVQSGIYLIHHGTQPLALLVRGPREMGMRSGIDVEVMAAERTVAENFLSELRTTMRANNVYRSHVVSLAPGETHAIEVHFHRLPAINRENIILPKGVLERIERQTIGFARLSQKLKAAGRHLKRGLRYMDSRVRARRSPRCT